MIFDLLCLYFFSYIESVLINSKLMQRILLFILILIGINSYSQSEANIFPQTKTVTYDTTRILDLSQKLSVWGYGIQKMYTINLMNTNTKKKLNLSPNGQMNFGLGFNYKWMGLGVAFKLPLSKNDDDIYGKTKRFDFQLNIFARSFGIDFSTQYYKGFYVTNPADFISWNREEFPTLPNLEILSSELSAYYFSNNKRFSYRAAFVRNEIQKKGAGSPIFGAYVRYDLAVSPDGFVPKELPESVKDTFDISAFITTNYGLSIGYTFTFVIWKKFFINISMVPGLGSKTLKVYTSEGEFRTKPGLSGRYVGRLALGYEHKYFYLGLSSTSISNNVTYENLTLSSSTTKFRIFVGKRFDLKKKKKKDI